MWIHPYLNFFCQCLSSVKETFNHFVCNRKVAWQFAAPFNDTWVAPIEELVAKDSVLHPKIIVRYWRYIACQFSGHLLEAIKIFQAVAKSEQVRQPIKTPPIKRSYSLIRELCISREVTMSWNINKPR